MTAALLQSSLTSLPLIARGKVRENYARRFSIRFPNEELAAGRPLRTSPIYDRLRSLGARDVVTDLDDRWVRDATRREVSVAQRPSCADAGTRKSGPRLSSDS